MSRWSSSTMKLSTSLVWLSTHGLKMKKIEPGLVLVACLTLSACGGGNSSATASPPAATSASIGGTLNIVLNGFTLLLSNNDTETIALNAPGNFTFAKKIEEGASYNVKIVGQPSGVDCNVVNGTGTVAHGVESVGNLSISCSNVFFTFIRFNVGVTVSGLLPGRTVSFLNNGTDTLSANDNGLFVFSHPYYLEAVYSGRAAGYEVVVQTNPVGQTCTLSNASGAMTGISNFVNVLATCK